MANSDQPPPPPVSGPVPTPPLQSRPAPPAPPPPKPEPEPEKHRERSFTLKMAIISAVAGVAGALVGGLFTFSAAQIQSQRQSDTEQITTKKDVYSTVLTDAIAVFGEEAKVVRALREVALPGRSDELNPSIASYNTAAQRASHSLAIMQLVESPAVEQPRKALSDNITEIDDDIDSILTQLNRSGNETVSKESMSSLTENVSQQQNLLDQLTAAMQKDMIPPQRGILDVF